MYSGCVTLSTTLSRSGGFGATTTTMFVSAAASAPGSAQETEIVLVPGLSSAIATHPPCGWTGNELPETTTLVVPGAAAPST